MKRFLLSLILFAAAPAFAQEYTNSTVSLELVGVASTDGQLVVSVYDSKKAWLKKPAHQKVVDASGVDEGRILIDLELPPGEYAVHVYHDLDGNGKMKANFVGIPKEPTGVSRDAKGKFGPPKFKDAMFAVGDESLSMTINIVSI